MLKAKSEATWHIKVLVDQLNTRFPDRNVRKLHSDQDGEFLSNELTEYCAQLGIKLTTTNAYSPQENGIVERANGIVLPRIRAMLTTTHLPNPLWGEALLHVVTTLDNLPTKPLGLVSPHQRLWKKEPMLGDLCICDCLAHVRIPPESRQKKEELSPRAKLCLLLGYGVSTPGYKFIDLVTAQVVTARGGNVRFHEVFTCNITYVKQLLENAYLVGDHELPEAVPVARIKTSMEPYLPGWSVETAEKRKQLEMVSLVDDPTENVQSSSGSQEDADSECIVELQCGVATPTAEQELAEVLPEAAKAKKRRKRKMRKKPAVEEKKERSGFEIQTPPVEPCQKQPRRKQKANVRLADYVVRNVLIAEDVPIPTTYKQARASKH
ncbi:polyprotein [Phytophthora megakarya]|uniref:Polyprotein n=1 Tax=Phytophthora megakarya TaxID=4795 RepID=A0A225VZZ1_9STRA|nr:polyprotein [Phytophthora megakarya]